MNWFTALLVETGVRFDGTITLGNVITSLIFLGMAIIAYRDLQWRIKNLEIWRKEHMVDADARDEIIGRMDKLVERIDQVIADTVVANRRRGNRY